MDTQAQTGRWQFWIDRGGTFTDIVAQRPDGTLLTHKLLSENAGRYDDAALAGIRDLLGVARDTPIPAERIAAVNQHFVLCGSGRVGRNVAHELSATGRSYVIIDPAMQEIEAHLEKHPTTLYVHGDATDDDVLIKAHVESAAGVFAITGDDGRNLLISITARQLNPNARIVARCHEVRNIEKLRKAGADAIVSPDFTGGMRIVSSMIRPQVVSFLDEMLRSDKNLRVEEIHVADGFRETTLGALNLHHSDYIVLALREKDSWQFNPGADIRIKPGATLVVMTTPGGREALSARFGHAALPPQEG